MTWLYPAHFMHNVCDEVGIISISQAINTPEKWHPRFSHQQIIVKQPVRALEFISWSDLFWS